VKQGETNTKSEHEGHKGESGGHGGKAEVTILQLPSTYSYRKHTIGSRRAAMLAG